jgi:hypothetical protein
MGHLLKRMLNIEIRLKRLQEGEVPKCPKYFEKVDAVRGSGA